MLKIKELSFKNNFSKHKPPLLTDTNSVIKSTKEILYIMKATGIVRRIDDLGKVVIPKEIRRTMRIREGEPLLTTLTPIDKFCWAIHSVVNRYKK